MLHGLVVMGEVVVLESAVLVNVFIHVVIHHGHAELSARFLIDTEGQVLVIINSDNFC